jgi:hypothetical protein
MTEFQGAIDHPFDRIKLVFINDGIPEILDERIKWPAMRAKIVRDV